MHVLMHQNDSRHRPRRKISGCGRIYGDDVILQVIELPSLMNNTAKYISMNGHSPVVGDVPVSESKLSW